MQVLSCNEALQLKINKKSKHVDINHEIIDNIMGRLLLLFHNIHTLKNIYNCWIPLV